MPENTEERSKDWTPLESAWEVLCDFGEPDSSRRATLREARRATRECSIADSANAFQLLALWEQKIKYEFGWRIFDGDFDAIGIDITDGVSNLEKPIPHRLFDQRAESFSIVWEENRLSVFGRTIVGIRVAPNTVDLPTEANSAKNDANVGGAVGVNPGGRPNKQKEAKELIASLFGTRKFRALPDREAQACEVRAQIMGDEHRYSHGAKDYKTETLKRWIGEVERDLDSGQTG